MSRSFFVTAAPATQRPGRSRAARRSGVACVELALLLPLLGMLVLGMFELARALQVRQLLTDAARKGCRTGIIHRYGNADIINDVTNVMQQNGFDTTTFNPSGSPPLGSITITVTDPNGNTLADALDAPPGTTVSVQVAIPSSSIRWVAAIWLTDDTVISDLVVMMKQ
jgi:Flp pilus assembly protein TadG